MKTSFAALFAVVLSACSAQAPESEVAGVPGSDVLRGRPGLEQDVVGGPANGACADAQGELLYSAFRYQGGAAPGPQITVASKMLKLAGETLGHIETKGDGAQEGEWSLSVEFVDGTKQVLESSGNGASGSETYAQKVKVAKGELALERFVICSNSWDFLRP